MHCSSRTVLAYNYKAEPALHKLLILYAERIHYKRYLATYKDLHLTFLNDSKNVRTELLIAYQVKAYN